ncbi:hypothetical protein LMTR13_26155 [Bradyrhizobium icense]|uniref:Uncharacterized protein n=1 Tax=Bradyrhizobium icense TaxID=1274631 RepID=A0A1B1UK58_9BRAD|nr:hypothetical protein LMTR13_26155 [Bradyrhizobium icense]
MELKFEGLPGTDETALNAFFSEMMPLESITLSPRTCRAISRGVCRSLSAVSEGPVKPHFKRQDETRRFSAEAIDKLERCLLDLERIG